MQTAETLAELVAIEREARVASEERERALQRRLLKEVVRHANAGRFAEAQALARDLDSILAGGIPRPHSTGVRS